MLDEDQLRNALLVLCNKQDLPSAMSPSATPRAASGAPPRLAHEDVLGGRRRDFEGLERLSQTLKNKPGRVAAAREIVCEN